MHHRCILSKWNKFFVKDLYIPRLGVAMTVCRMMRYILSCFVPNVYINCVVQDFLYFNVDIVTMWHCALVRCTQSQSIELVFGGALFWCWLLLYFSFTNYSIECYFIMMVATTIGIFMSILFILTYTLKLSDTRQFCNYALPGCFSPWTFSMYIWLNMLPSNSITVKPLI